MEDGELSSLIEGLSQPGPLVLTSQSHYTLISADQPFPTPSPSPSIILRSPAAVPPASPGQARSPVPSPARPNTPQPALTQYSSITPNANQLVQLFQNQSNSVLGRSQIIQTAAVQAQALKGKQPQQILPKPLLGGSNAAKQPVARLAQPTAPLLINQHTPPSPTLLLNQVLTSGSPMLVQPANTGGTVHLMLRPPPPTIQSGPGPPQGKVVIGGATPQQAPTVLIQQSRQQQVMRIMTAQGPMQVQLQQIQTPSGPQLVAIPAGQPMSFPTGSVLVQPTQMPVPLQQPPLRPAEPPKKRPITKKPKPIKARSDSSTSPPSSREDLSPPAVSPKVLTSPMCSPPPPQKNITSSLRQIRPSAFAKKQSNEGGKDMKSEEGPKPPPVVDNLTATINSVAENIKSPSSEEPLGPVLSGTRNLNLNKRPNLTIFQKTRPEDAGIQTTAAATEDIDDDEKRRNGKKTAVKKKTKKDESKVDLWDLMKSAGIGDEEFEETNVDLGAENLDVTGGDSELLAQLQSSQALQLSGGLRLAVGEDGRPVLIDGSNLLIPEPVPAQTLAQSAPHDAAMLNLTPQALATAQSQLTQLLQDHGAVGPADQQLMTQIFTVNPSQSLGLLGVTQPEDVHVESHSSVATETEPPIVAAVAQQKVEAAPQILSPPPPPPGLPPLGPDSLVITNNNGVPTLVASPALLQYLQTHQGIIQFQHDPVTKTIQPSLIIPHPQPQSQPPSRVETKSPRLATPIIKEIARPTTPVDGSQNTLFNMLRQQSVPSGVKLSMARMIQENPALLQVARDTSSLITYKESCPTLSEAELADIDRKIQANKQLLDQCFHMELGKAAGGKENVVYQVAGTQTIQDLNSLDVSLIKGFQGPPSTNSPTGNSEFQNKFLEAIGMTNNSPVQTVKATVSVGTTTPQASPQGVTQSKRPRKKKNEKGEPPPVMVAASSGLPPPPPPSGNLTFNIKQLTPEQNERLNIALNQRGVTANQVATCALTDVEKQIIEEEIRRVTGGVLGNATVKFFPPQSTQDEGKISSATMTRLCPEEEEIQQSAMVLNNPNLNQLLDAPVGGQLVTLGSSVQGGGQLLALGSPPPPGSVIVGSNGNVFAIVQHPPPGRGVPTLQLTAPKQQMLKSIQSQIQALSGKTVQTPAEQTILQNLRMEQQKIVASANVISSSAPHNIQIVSQAAVPRVYQSNYVVSKANTNAVSCGTSTSDFPLTVQQHSTGIAVTSKAIKNDLSVQYGPLYVSPNSSGKHVTKCEKGTSPIQIQMGTQTSSTVDYRTSKMSTGTMTSPNTGKPQAVVAPAIVHVQPSEPPASSTPWVKQARRCPSPVLAISKTALIEKQMLNDQAGAAHPDTKTPFLSKSDAVKRLVRYHVMEERGLNQQDLQAADDMFEATSQHLLEKFRVMKDKYKYLLLMESMREVSTAERIMVDRNFIIEERIELEDLREKERRAQEVFENPPPPPPTPVRTQKTEFKTEEDKLEASSVLSPSTNPSVSPATSSQPESADISAQVQSAIDSILNLQQSDDADDERRKRKRPRHVNGNEQNKKKGRQEDEEGGASDADPALDEAIRSILTS